MDGPLYMMICFIFAISKIWSLLLSFENLIIICLGVGLFDSSYLEFVELLNIYIHVYYQIREVFSHYFFIYSLCPCHSSSPRTLVTHTLFHLMIYLRLQVLSAFLHSFLFLLFSLDNFHGLIFMLRILVGTQICLSIPLVNF